MFQNNKANGFGIRINCKIIEYSGSYKDGKRHGQGAEYSATTRYIGGWKSGDKDGFGAYVQFQYGRLMKYVGEWKQEKNALAVPHGHGIYFERVGDQVVRLKEGLFILNEDSLKLSCKKKILIFQI